MAVRRTRRTRARLFAALAGAVSAFTVLGLSELIAGLSRALPSPVTTVGDLVEGRGGLAWTVGLALYGAAVGFAAKGSQVAAIVGLAGLGAGGGVAIVRATDVSPPLQAVSSSLSVAAGLVTFRVLAMMGQPGTARTPVAPGPGRLEVGAVPGAPRTRRDFFGMLSGGATAALAVAIGVRLSRSEAVAPDRPDGSSSRPTVGRRPSEELAPGTRVVPSSIDATGATAVGEELSRWLAAVAHEATVIRFQPEGTYRVDDASVALEGFTGVTLDFNGATLQRSRILDQPLRYPNRNGFLRVLRSRDVTIENLRVRGINASEGLPTEVVAANDRAYPMEPGDPTQGSYCVALEFEHGIDLVDCQNVTVERCDLAGMFGDGIYGQGELDGVWIRNVDIGRNGRQGMAFVQGRNITVHDAWIIDSRRSGIDLEPNSTTDVMEHIEITDCRIRSRLLAFASKGRGRVDRVRIAGNVIEGSGVPVIYVVASDDTVRDDWVIEENTMVDPLGSPKALVELGNVTGAVVRHNHLRARPEREMTAVEADGATQVHIHGNRFEGCVEVVRGTGEWEAVDNALT
jgi:hypothetical protein